MFTEKVEPQQFSPLVSDAGKHLFLSDAAGNLIGLNRVIDVTGTELYTAALKASKRVNLLSMTDNPVLAEQGLTSSTDHITAVMVTSVLTKNGEEIKEYPINMQLNHVFNGGNAQYVGSYACGAGEIHFTVDENTGDCEGYADTSYPPREIIGYQIVIERGNRNRRPVAHHPV